MLVNPLLADEMKNRHLGGDEGSQIAYRCGVIETDKEITNPADWTDQALQLVTVVEDHSLVIQHGVIRMTLPSDQEVDCGILIVFAISETSRGRQVGDESPPVYVVALNHQVAPLGR
jgi:hypothetical protein